MGVLLIHKTFDGEPVGVWNDVLESAYTPGREDMHPAGLATVSTRGFALPWSVFANRKMESTNFQDWWEVFDTPQTLPDALDTARTRFFSQQSADTARDR